VLAFDGLLVAKAVRIQLELGRPQHAWQRHRPGFAAATGGQEIVLHQGRSATWTCTGRAAAAVFRWPGDLEINVDGSGLRRVSKEDPPVTHYDACYLPDGRICCVSNACEQAVPCTGANVGNLHLMDADGGNETRVASIKITTGTRP